MSNHIPDQRTYAFHQKAAEILLANPERIDEIYKILNHWSSMEGTQAQSWAIKWLDTIRGLPVEKVAALIVRQDEQMDFFRKSSPFAGLLSEDERTAILRRYKFSYE